MNVSRRKIRRLIAALCLIRANEKNVELLTRTTGSQYKEICVECMDIFSRLFRNPGGVFFSLFFILHGNSLNDLLVFSMQFYRSFGKKIMKV